MTKKDPAILDPGQWLPGVPSNVYKPSTITQGTQWSGKRDHRINIVEFNRINKVANQ